MPRINLTLHALNNHAVAPLPQFLDVLPDVGNFPFQQHLGLSEIRRNQGRQWEHFLFVSHDAAVAHQLHPIAIHNDWVNYFLYLRIAHQQLRHPVNNLGCGQHPCLDAMCTHVAQKRLCLTHHKLHRQRCHTFYSAGVFIHNARQCTCGISATSRNRLNVILHARTAQRLAACNQKHNAQLLFAHRYHL